MIPRPIEVSLYKILKEKKNKKFLLAVSGGLDSMALLYAFNEISKKLNFEFAVAYIHHGPAAAAQLQFRHQAREFVRDFCSSKKIPFFTNDEKSQKEVLVSEQQLRHLRLTELARIKKTTASDFVVFSHHRDDLLETRLLRLIRGTGPEGLIAMREEKGAILRPFLRHSKAQLKSYLQMMGRGEKKLWLEDPSNENSHFLRNWLRNKWLPALERRRSGSLSGIERSLQSLADLIADSGNLEAYFDGEKISRTLFLQLSLTDKRRVLAFYLRRKECKDFGLSHINELIKRLDVEQKDLTFSLLKKNWLANARHIWCEG